MSCIQLRGVDGSNPLGFMAALGLLRLAPGAKLGFSDDGSFRARVDGLTQGESEFATFISEDAKAAEDSSAPWRFTYTKAATKKQGPQEVADLKPPPEDFRRFLATCVEAWILGNAEAAGYAAAYGTDVAVDGKDNTKPTAFHFTAAQQTFLGSVDAIRASVTPDWVKESLFDGHGEKPGSNLRWDPGSERNWALMANNPSGDGTLVDAPLEWLAFRALPFLPSFPRGSRVVTTGVVGRGDDMMFTWPLWTVPASRHTARSVLQVDWSGSAEERAARGIFAMCGSAIRRTSQGFGNFGPSSVTS
ncbi:MAG: hypothetical protein IT459_10735 [Planctomycetes bacterium]|nr:hypothetical protein [Planctomycetota bacterium]